MNQETIYDIEKRVAELKYRERDLMKERDIGRLKSLDKAEKSETVERFIDNFFINYAGAGRNDLLINSFPSKSIGRNDEEFMSEVKVEIRFKTLKKRTDYNELALYVYLINEFQDKDVQKMEKQVMDKLIKIRKDVHELKESKKSLKKE